MCLLLMIAAGVVLGLFIFKKPMAAMMVVIGVLLLAPIMVSNSPAPTNARPTLKQKAVSALETKRQSGYRAERHRSCKSQCHTAATSGSARGAGPNAI